MWCNLSNILVFHPISLKSSSRNLVLHFVRSLNQMIMCVTVFTGYLGFPGFFFILPFFISGDAMQYWKVPLVLHQFQRLTSHNILRINLTHAFFYLFTHTPKLWQFDWFISKLSLWQIQITQLTKLFFSHVSLLWNGKKSISVW